VYGAFCKGMAPSSNNTLSDDPSCLPTHGRAIRLIAACVCTSVCGRWRLSVASVHAVRVAVC
jgi:hypothetical protein